MSEKTQPQRLLEEITGEGCDQPKWTAATVSKLIDAVSLSGVADAHNAALAAERKARAFAEDANKRALDWAREHAKDCPVCGNKKLP